MAEQNTQAKLKQMLKQEKIQLWNPPFTNEEAEQEQLGVRHMQDLAQRYAPLLALPVAEVGGALEVIRVQAVNRGKGNKMFRETNVAVLELLLPRLSSRKDSTSKKNYLETKLDVSVQEVVNRIREEFGLSFIKLILNGKTLSPEQRLDEQGVKNHSKLMVLKVSDAEIKQQTSQDEMKKKQQNQSLQRTFKGFHILSERDGSEDPETTPFLEITDQKGNPLKIPHTERKALILAMGFHEKGRSLMKKKQYEDALCHLLLADQHFSVCGSALLSLVDNFAVLQLDIVWCYQLLEALSCLEDGRRRLELAEDNFNQCYGQELSRLHNIQGSSGREEVLFLRLFLLQSLLCYVEGNDVQARHLLTKVESLFARLCSDSEQMTQLLLLGFTEREARLGLRACAGDAQGAALHISTRRQEQQALRERERSRHRATLADVSLLVEFGFSRSDAARALHQSGGDVNKACELLQEACVSAQTSNNNSQGGGAPSPEQVEQLLYLGFESDAAEAALISTGGDVQSAAELLLDNQGLAPPPSPGEGGGAATPSTSTEDEELVSEVLEDLSHDEDDYLNLTLEEEKHLMETMKTYLNTQHIHTV